MLETYFPFPFISGHLPLVWEVCFVPNWKILGLWSSSVRETMKSKTHTKHDDDVTAPLSSDIVDPLACLVKTVCVCYVIHHHCNCAVADVTEKQITCYGCVSNYEGRIPTIIHTYEVHVQIHVLRKKFHLGMRLRNLSCPAVSQSCSRTVRSWNSKVD